MKPKKIKARKMHSTEVRTHCVILFGNRSSAAAFHAKPEPHYVLPADAASVEAMVQQMGNAMASYPTFAPTFDILARAALAAIGVK